LGVVTKKEGQRDPQLQFYNWKSLEDSEKVGDQTFPVPNRVVWHPEGLFVAMLYPTSMTLYTYDAQDKESPFNELATRSVEAVSLLWGENRVFVATPSDIRCYYLDIIDEPLILAYSGGQCSDCEEFFPYPQNIRPIGDIEIVGETEQGLFVADIHRCTYQIPASSTYMSCMTAIAAGDPETAVTLASSLPPQFLRPIEVALAKRGFVKNALSLPNMSDWHKLQHCVGNGFLSDAVPLLEKVVQHLQKEKQGKEEEQQDEMDALIDLEDIVVELKPTSTADKFSAEAVLGIASELAASCRAYEKPSEDVVALGPDVTEIGETSTVRALAPKVLETVRCLDIGKVSLLQAMHYATTEDKNGLRKLRDTLRNEVAAKGIDDDTKAVLRSVLLFADTCLDDPKAQLDTFQKLFN